jgi:hypothetical protein
MVPAGLEPTRHFRCSVDVGWAMLDGGLPFHKAGSSVNFYTPWLRRSPHRFTLPRPKSERGEGGRWRWGLSSSSTATDIVDGGADGAGRGIPHMTYPTL